MNPPPFDGYQCSTDYWREKAQHAEELLWPLVKHLPCQRCGEVNWRYYPKPTVADPTHAIRCFCLSCEVGYSDFPCVLNQGYIESILKSRIRK